MVAGIRTLAAGSESGLIAGSFEGLIEPAPRYYS
jgi:hypothetical protein